jgi:hypothetical protein
VPRRGSAGSGSQGVQQLLQAPDTARSDGGHTQRGSRLRIAVGSVIDANSNIDAVSGSGSPVRTQRGASAGAPETPTAADAISEAAQLAVETFSMGARDRGTGGTGSVGGGSSTGGGDRAVGGAGAGFGGSRGPTLQMLIESLGLDDQIEQLLKVSALADQEWEDAQSQQQQVAGPASPRSQQLATGSGGSVSP